MLDTSQIDIQPTAADVTIRVGNWLIDRIQATTGVFRLCLSGGSTPKALFKWLALPLQASRVPWARLHVFWGDERYVPYDSTDSNFGEARRLLFDHVPIPAENLHPMPAPDFAAQPAEADDMSETAALRYADLLQREYGATTLDPARPLFDVNMLGLGEDGHTASLIPGQPVLSERALWVAAVGKGRPEVRLTMTYPVLESAEVVAFLVVGAGKRDILTTIRTGHSDVPAARLQPRGATVFFTDQAASG